MWAWRLDDFRPLRVYSLVVQFFVVENRQDVPRFWWYEVAYMPLAVLHWSWPENNVYGNFNWNDWCLWQADLHSVPSDHRREIYGKVCLRTLSFFECHWSSWSQKNWARLATLEVSKKAGQKGGGAIFDKTFQSSFTLKLLTHLAGNSLQTSWRLNCSGWALLLWDLKSMAICFIWRVFARNKGAC